MRTFQMHLLEADKVFFEGECESLVVPTTVGQYGILAGHSNMISAVVPGVLSYRAPGKEWRTAAVSEGMVKVEGNDVLVLVDSAEYPEEIDAKRAQRAADEAKEAILQKRSVRETPYPFEEESALLAAFENADTDAAVAALHAFFARLHAVRPDSDTLSNIVGKLSYELIRTARQKLAVLTVPSPTPAPQADEETCEATLTTYIRQCLQEQESRSSSELVQRIMQYLEQNYAQNITLSSLEDAFFFNASYISRVFKQKTGKNYSDYLLGIRLEHAKELLRDSHHSIAYISDVTGFGNSKYFSKI